jgi:hypothetical protein
MQTTSSSSTPSTAPPPYTPLTAGTNNPLLQQRAAPPPPAGGIVLTNFQVGNTSTPSPTLADRYDWQFFLRAGKSLAVHIEKVVVKLHPTFAVSEHTLTSADADGTFTTPTITGWGVFQLQVEVHWKAASNVTSLYDGGSQPSPTLMLAHMLELAHPVVSRTVDLQHLFLAPTPAAGVVLAASVSSPPPPEMGAAVQEQAAPGFFGRMFGGSPQQPLATPAPHVQAQTAPMMQQQQNYRGGYGGGSRGYGGGGSRYSRGGAGFVSSNAGPAPDPITVTLGKPTNAKHTVLAMVVDRSGSMQTMGSEVEGGCNAYLDEQRKSDAEDVATTHVVMCTFDNTVECVHDNAALTDVAPITHEQVEPRGMTALYDAIGDALTRTAAVVNGLDHAPNVTIFILTDGQENSSHKWSKQAIATEIGKLQKPEGGGWDFYFAAANQDAMAEGSRLGMDSEQCMSFGNSGAKMKSAMVYAKQAHTRKSKGMTKGFSAEERSSCM